MRTRVGWLLIVVCLAFAAGLVLPAPAYADGITFTGPTSISVTDTGAAYSFFYTLTNNSSGTLTYVYPTEGYPTVSGDPDESSAIIYGEFGTATCTGYTPLASGSSCTMELAFNTTGGTDDGDSYTFAVTLGATWTGISTPSNLNVEVTINDPSVVPEPASLPLLASGLLGLMAIALRRRTAATH